MSVKPIVNDTRGCREALARTTKPVVLDLETTGLLRRSQIVSAGLLVDGTPHLLFVRSAHASVPNLPAAALRRTLAPLARRDLVVVGHNLPFDLGFLHREGVTVAAEARDTLKILRLLDQDRAESGQGRTEPRSDRRAPAGASPALNYKLKDVARQLLGLRMPHFPGSIATVPLAAHARYLTSDLIGTEALYQYLWPRLGTRGQRYYQRVVGPLIPELLAMGETGVAADGAFIRRECERLQELAGRLSTEHERSLGLPLGLDEGAMRRWLFGELRLPKLKHNRRRGRWVPSLDREAFRRLGVYNVDPRTTESLRLIGEYRRAWSLLVRLRALEPYVDVDTGRIHSTFDDRQATGRLSSAYPNLQQLAKTRTVDGEEVRSRNALAATPGYELAVFDVAQADVRVLASAIENFGRKATEHLERLRERRRRRLGPRIGRYLRGLGRHRNPSFVRQPCVGPEPFDPTGRCFLAEDFRAPGDFYTNAVTRMTGQLPRDKAHRDWYKPIILAVINGKGAKSLARDLGCSSAEARSYLEKFDDAYPDVAAYKEMIYDQIALTGRTRTFLGRSRTVTAHRWMATRSRVEILVTYKGGDRYWLDIVPLEPRRRVLTSYVLRARDARTDRLIYDHKRGQLSSHPYRLFDEHGLQYRLPYRNWAWRSVRRVRAGGQEARYEGFDATARAAFNFVCQAGTADVAKLMMLRAGPLCQRHGARLLIQIHDELVFEVLQAEADAFLAAMKTELEQPPTRDFRVPIVVEAKRGRRFGELAKFPPDPGQGP